METSVHPTAIIENGAELDQGVNVGAYAYIGAFAKIGSGTHIMHHATVDGNTVLGKANEVHPYAYVGGKTHDLKYKGGVQNLKIGDRNVFREFTTVHCATAEGLLTELGNDNVILSYSHIAHECVVGDHLIMSSHAALGGHVQVGNHVNIGWGSGIHQHCRVGDHAMVGASSLAVQDIPPYVIANGNPAKSRTINKIGLERSGFTQEQISAIRNVYRLFYKKQLNRSQAIEALKETDLLNVGEVKHFCSFIESSERGIA
jgi:UDP-N-acetylglucosamine acyltransferase